MNDLKWLAIVVAVIATVCFFITGPDRRTFRHWWRRRANGRNVPWTKLILTFLPLFLGLVAGALWWAAQGKESA